MAQSQDRPRGVRVYLLSSNPFDRLISVSKQRQAFALLSNINDVTNSTIAKRMGSVLHSYGRKQNPLVGHKSNSWAKSTALDKSNFVGKIRLWRAKYACAHHLFFSLVFQIIMPAVRRILPAVRRIMFFRKSALFISCAFLYQNRVALLFDMSEYIARGSKGGCRRHSLNIFGVIIE